MSSPVLPDCRVAEFWSIPLVGSVTAGSVESSLSVLVSSTVSSGGRVVASLAVITSSLVYRLSSNNIQIFLTTRNSLISFAQKKKIHEKKIVV